MWIEIKETKEWIPFDTEHTAKVFFDGKKGWAIKQKDGKLYHVPDDIYEGKMLRELDSDAYWKKRQIEDMGSNLTADNIKDIKELLTKLKKKKEEKED